MASDTWPTFSTAASTSPSSLPCGRHQGSFHSSNPGNLKTKDWVTSQSPCSPCQTSRRSYPCPPTRINQPCRTPAQFQKGAKHHDSPAWHCFSHQGRTKPRETSQANHHGRSWPIPRFRYGWPWYPSVRHRQNQPQHQDQTLHCRIPER